MDRDKLFIAYTWETVKNIDINEDWIKTLLDIYVD